MSLKLKGLIIALPTPWNSKEIQETAFRTHVSRLLPFASGFVCAGTTGEGWALSEPQLKRLLQIVKEVAPSLPRFGVIWRSTPEAVFEALQLDADALLTPLPTALQQAPEEDIVDFFVALGEKSPLPLLLYNIPKRTGNRAFTVPTVEKIIARTSKVIGLKDSSPDHPLLRGCLEAKLPLLSIPGNDRYVLGAMKAWDRAYGATEPFVQISGPSCVPWIGELEESCHQAFRQRAWEKIPPLLKILESQVWEPLQGNNFQQLLKTWISETIPGYPTVSFPA